MRFLIVGDIVGATGLNKLREIVPNMIKEEKIDFCIVNGENTASGKGIRLKEYNEILNIGADAVTMGNHIYYRKEMASEYIKLDRLVIPANITDLKGNGSICTVSKINNKKIGVINLIGEFGMGTTFEGKIKNPFEVVIEEINKLKEQNVDYIFVDFHAEGTAEKIAMGYFLEDKVNCVFGTHTHVQTADEQIFNTGMAYITDVGMTGPKCSVIGLKKELALVRFTEKKHVKYMCSENEAQFNAIIIDYDDVTKKAISIKRINK